jgi:hypothetical protein
MLECKKVKSWLKSVSAFANTDGGSLFYGVNDDGVIVGLENPQADADFISEMIKARLDPVPEVQLIPIEHEGHTLLEVKVKAGTLTPYYYYQDGTRTAYVRVGNESVECNSQQLLSLVLKGTHIKAVGARTLKVRFVPTEGEFQVSGVAVPIGPYEPKQAARTASNAEQSLHALEKLGLDVSIEDTARKQK